MITVNITIDICKNNGSPPNISRAENTYYCPF